MHLNKKNRKEGRNGQSGKIKNVDQCNEMIQAQPLEFYSLGNSLMIGESISLSSVVNPSSKIPSTGDVQSNSSIKSSTKWKQKGTKVDIFNFSDRTLSSKLYSIKRKEISLFEKDTKSRK